jgi:hypothetical protein
MRAKEARWANLIMLICRCKEGSKGTFYVVAADQVCGNWRRRKKKWVWPEKEDGARYIPLVQGGFAVVDAEDYERLMKHKWYLCQEGNVFYAFRYTIGKQIRMHREIMNAPKGVMVDHIDRNGLYNRKRNLRHCNRRQNSYNRRGNSRGSSQYKGVFWHNVCGKWEARITYNGNTNYLGLYENERDAARAYDEKAKEFYGDFAYLNLGD